MENVEYLKMKKLHESYWWFKGKKEIILHLIEKYHPEAKKLQLLDIGCGDGYFFDKYSGVGIEPSGIFKNKNILNQKIEDVDIKEKFDVILCLDVLEHLQNDQVIKKFLEENLKKDGLAIITVPAHRKLFGEHDKACHHFRRYDFSDLVNLLNEFQPQIYYYNSLLYPLEYIFRKLSRGKNNLNQLPKFLNFILFNIFRLEKYLLTYFKNGMSLVAIIKG